MEKTFVNVQPLVKLSSFNCRMTGAVLVNSTVEPQACSNNTPRSDLQRAHWLATGRVQENCSENVGNISHDIVDVRQTGEKSARVGHLGTWTQCQQAASGTTANIVATNGKGTPSETEVCVKDYDFTSNPLTLRRDMSAPAMRCPHTSQGKETDGHRHVISPDLSGQNVGILSASRTIVPPMFSKLAEDSPTVDPAFASNNRCSQKCTLESKPSQSANGMFNNSACCMEQISTFHLRDREGRTSDSSKFCRRQLTIGHPSDSVSNRAVCAWTSDRMDAKLQVLRSELTAIRAMDLVLLKQLIDINLTIHRVQRSDVLKVARSLSFASPTKQLHHRVSQVERQYSAPHSATHQRDWLSRQMSSTDHDLGDSLSSFDQSEMDSQSNLEESNSSISSPSPTTSTSLPLEDILSTDFRQDVGQVYEDILRRNVRFWKLSSQGQRSPSDEIVIL